MPHAVARFAPGTGHGWLGVDFDLHLAMSEAWFSGAALPDGLEVETIDWPRPEMERLIAGSA